MKRPMNVICLLFVTILFASCGKNGAGTSTAASGVSSNGAGICTAGSVWNSSQGCLDGYPDAYGMGYGNNGQPVSGQCWSGTTMSCYGCQVNPGANFMQCPGAPGYGSF